MILVDKKKYLDYEWEFIIFLNKTYGNNENIELLLKCHFLGLRKWDMSFFDNTCCIKLVLSDVSSIVINMLDETYSVYYKQHKITTGLLTISNLKEASLIAYNHYQFELDNNNDEIGKYHPFYKSILSTSLKYIYG